MPVAGVGGLLGNMFFPGLDDRMAQHITPNPNPLVQQGGPAQPGQVDQLGNLAPPAVTAPDPANAANVAALTQPSNAYARDAMAMTRRDAMARGVNEGLDQIAAGFGTAAQQASKQNALRGGGGGVGGSLADLADIQKMQDQTIQDNEHARFMGNAAIFAQTLSTSLGRPVSVQEATEIMNSPELMKSFGGAAGANAEATGTMKDAEAATRAYADAHKNATPQEIADYKANLIAGGMGGSDLAQRQYLAERSAALAAGQKDFPDYPTWQANHAADAAAQKKTADDAAEFKDTAVTDYGTVHSKLANIQQSIDVLTKNPAAAQEAMKTFLPTTGNFGALMPGAVVSQEVKSAAVALKAVQAALKSDQLSGVKNVRNLQEFNTLGQAATGGLDAAATPEDFAKSIDNLSNKYLDAQATAELAAGHKLTGKLVGHGNRDLLSPTLPSGKKNPFYNGGTEDVKSLAGPELDQVKQALAAHPERRDEILETLRKNGYDAGGL